MNCLHAKSTCEVVVHLYPVSSIRCHPCLVWCCIVFYCLMQLYPVACSIEKPVQRLALSWLSAVPTILLRVCVVCMYCFVVFNQPVFYCLVLYCIILYCNIHSPLLSGAIMSCIVMYGMEPVSPNCPHVCMYACIHTCMQECMLYVCLASIYACMFVCIMLFISEYVLYRPLYRPVPSCIVLVSPLWLCKPCIKLYCVL